MKPKIDATFICDLADALRDAVVKAGEIDTFDAILAERKALLVAADKEVEAALKAAAACKAEAEASAASTRASAEALHGTAREVYNRAAAGAKTLLASAEEDSEALVADALATATSLKDEAAEERATAEKYRAEQASLRATIDDLKSKLSRI